MQETNSSYRSVFKATSLFGGVQVFQILIQIIKSKIIAVLIGPAGVGIIGLFQSGLDLIKNITSMGLSSSAVRDVSEANGTGDINKVSNTLNILRRLVWITGLLGLLMVAAFSPLLSKTLFGKYDYTLSFILLSITLLFDQISAGQRVVLQGLRKLKDLAKCSAIGVTLGLLVSIPFYYWMRIEGIVPTLILTSLCSLVVSWWYSRKIKYDKKDVTIKESLVKGKQMLVMGVSLSISGILTTATAYVTRSYIQSVGGVEEVGLYHAGFVIMTSYVGLVMNAIATDYYPRLASINNDNEKCREAICQQGEIGTMILAPLLVLCLVFMPFVLKILYSDDFLSANLFISWASLGMLLRLGAWVISFLFVAKAESKLFIINELISNAYFLVFNIIGYRIWGLQGLGIAFVLSYSMYFLQVYLIARSRFDFHLSAGFIWCFGVQVLLIVSCLILVLNFDGLTKYLIGSVLILTSGGIGLYGLNKRMDIVSLIKQRLNR